jgi:hypothetical protein
VDDHLHLNKVGTVVSGMLSSYLLTKSETVSTREQITGYAVPRVDVIEAILAGKYIYPSA